MAEKQDRQREQVKSLSQLRREYEALLAPCAAFDGETRRLLREREKQQAAWIVARNAERAKLMAAKAAAYAAFHLADEVAKKAAEEAAKKVS